MANLEKRPFVGSWRLNNRSVVKYTPDALIFINGDTSLPGCARCRGRIEVQKFVTGLSVEAGTDPMSHSASINLALPRVQGQQVFIDGYNILRPGLEVHIFMRGYFPIRGMFSHLANPQTGPAGDPTPHDSNQLDMTKYATYPYYPVFHGLITQSSYEYSDGFYYGTLNCTSLLHFWQYVNITTSAAFEQNTIANNDIGRTTLFGHNFNNTHPFAIIYTLYTDVAGTQAGADFALSQATNADEVAAATGNDGQSIYDMVSIYWEQRFKTRIQSLRMYGVNGQLFNAAQQAWLGTNRDADQLMTSATANDPTTTNSVRDPFSARLSVAKALGLQGAGADFTYSPLIQQDNEFFNLSVLSMYAFQQTKADIGTVALWQTTYQTKMDVAQRVMEVTGYEFYQDVDGDLVFKPPFWNLDTAPNRYYRLNDSDIINITFTEKEPNATYIIVRGVWINGLKTELDSTDVLTKRGLYVDYKLVAKFGWRPAPTLELTYVLDPKVLFWIGVARLDMLNVDTFSASATIPIRAELRPGFPVYIPFVDSYYYITQLSHAFSFGGQCTTSLVLTCRRSKWHAPGFLKAANPGDSAIDLIRLDRPDLPPRPLEIFVNDIPRIVGFPNVVMALDPRKFNPNFSVVGVGLDYFLSVDETKQADLLWSLLIRDIHLLNAFNITAGAVGPDGKTYIEDPTQVTQLRLSVSGKDDIHFSVKDLKLAFKALRGEATDLSTVKNKLDRQDETVADADQAFNAFKLATQVGQAAGLDPNSARGKATSERDAVSGQLQRELVKYNDTLTSSASIDTLVQVFEALQPDSNKPIRRKIDGIPGSDVTLSFFQTLGHLKGQYMASTVPGHYRYFSCSHPSESQQGMPLISWDDGKRSKGPVPRPTRSGSRSGSSRRNRGVDPTPVITESRDRRDRERKEKLELQARFDERGITWIRAGEFTKFRNNGVTWINGKETTVEAIKEQPLTEGIAENIVNLGVATQELIDRLSSNPQFAGYTIGTSGKSWAPGAETDKGDESHHAAGRAIDIGVVSPSKKRTNDRYDILVSEAGKMWAEGWFGGFGTYLKSEDASGKSFVHVDIRESKKGDRWGEEQKKLDGKGEVLRFRNAKVAFVEARVQQETQDALAAAGIAARNGTKPQLWEQKSPIPTPAATPAPAVPLPGLTDVVPTSEPAEAPSVTLQEVSLQVARVVVQFQEKTQKPSKGRRAPEVILSTGKCRKGLQLAQGPNRTPEVITTDQIQSIGFIRHQAGKFTQVVGTSQNSGTKSFSAVSLQKQVADIFKSAIQDLDDPDVTVAFIFGNLYTDISENLESVPIPTFDPETGSELGDVRIKLRFFSDVLVVEASEVPPSVVALLEADGIAAEEQYLLGDLSFRQLAMIPGYKATGDSQNNGQGWQRPAEAAASAYAIAVVRQIESGNVELSFSDFQDGAGEPQEWPGYLKIMKDAQTPSKEKQDRLGAIQTAFDEALTKAFGAVQAQEASTPNTTEEKAVSQGKIEKPVHSPVFPVSDEKGYEHYGAYRYGRGLSVEPGGTFEYLHSGKDPFRNVTPQTTQEFLRVLTLVKTDNVDGNAFGNVASAALDSVLTFLNIKQDPLSTEGLSPDVASQGGATQDRATATVGATDAVQKARLSENERAQVEQSAQSLAETVTALNKTPRGQDTLRELLRANGDNPDILEPNGTFDITDTQFFRNFVNSAATFGKSPVFKTTAANAAYRLADLTTHLLDRAGQSCVCRGALSDVTMEAYSRDNMIDTVDGVDPATEKPEAVEGELNKQAEPSWTVQQQHYRGQHPDDAGGSESLPGTVGAGTGGAFGGNGSVNGDGADLPVTTSENSVTANPDDLPSVDTPVPGLTTDEALATLSESFDKEGLELEETGDTQGFLNEVGGIIEEDFPLSVLQTTYEKEGVEGLERLIREAEAEQGSDLRVSAQDLEAYIYLKSTQIKEIPPGTTVPPNLNVPPVDLRSEGQASFEEGSGYTVEEAIRILESNNEEAINQLLLAIPGKQNARSELKALKEIANDPDFIPNE